ncbi:MAG: RidA family protein [Oscillospiraceae bacterium]|nr:RidA family protein [Oscillospiraceae bacterium]MBR7150060.1 RidA family protein [Oscillospiraceae bacterium]
MKTVISTTAAPGAIGPYSQAIEANGFVFISGQLAIDPATGEFKAGTIEEQTEQALKNLKAIAEAAGCSLSDVVKTTVFLTDMGNFAAMNGVYAKFFTTDCPGRSAVQVAALPKGAIVEVEAIIAK